MSKTKILVHIVFSTKHRHQTIPLLHKRDLYKYLHGIISNEKCHTLRINGMTDHVHILIDLHPSVALAHLVKKLKQASSVWMKNSLYFTLFEAWNEGYYAVSVTPQDADACINYIKNQENHHGGKGFLEEIKELAMMYHLDWDERDWGTTPPGLDG